MKYGILLLIVIVLSAANLKAQLVVRKTDDAVLTASADGFLYSLPRTGIRIDIQVKKTQKIKGPYAEFADKYLGLTQVININSTEYEIASIQLSSYTEPDPAEYYFLQYTPGKQKERKEIELFFTPDGSLAGLSGTGAEPVAGSVDKRNEGKGVKMPEIANPTLFERVDTVIRRISVDTTTIEQKIFRKISSAKTSDQKAKEAADFILKLDESMLNLINGYQEVNYEKGTMEFMFSQMSSLKDDYLQLFKGITGVSTESYSFTYVPQKNDQELVSICRFSLGKGILDKNSQSGDLVQLEIKPMDITAAIHNLTEQRNTMNRENKGIYYRIPDEARIVVKLGGQVRAESQIPVNQFGVITFLPANSISNLELFNNTGGLKHVILK